MKITKEYLKELIKEELQSEIFGFGKKTKLTAAQTNILNKIANMPLKPTAAGNLRLVAKSFERDDQATLTKYKKIYPIIDEIQAYFATSSNTPEQRKLVVDAFYNKADKLEGK